RRGHDHAEVAGVALELRLYREALDVPARVPGEERLLGGLLDVLALGREVTAGRVGSRGSEQGPGQRAGGDGQEQPSRTGLRHGAFLSRRRPRERGCTKSAVKRWGRENLRQFTRSNYGSAANASADRTLVLLKLFDAFPRQRAERAPVPWLQRPFNAEDAGGARDLALHGKLGHRFCIRGC